MCFISHPDDVYPRHDGTQEAPVGGHVQPQLSGGCWCQVGNGQRPQSASRGEADLRQGSLGSHSYIQRMHIMDKENICSEGLHCSEQQKKKKKREGKSMTGSLSGTTTDVGLSQSDRCRLESFTLFLQKRGVCQNWLQKGSETLDLKDWGQTTWEILFLFFLPFQPCIYMETIFEVTGILPNHVPEWKKMLLLYVCFDSLWRCNRPHSPTHPMTSNDKPIDTHIRLCMCCQCFNYSKTFVYCITSMDTNHVIFHWTIWSQKFSFYHFLELPTSPTNKGCSNAQSKNEIFRSIGNYRSFKRFIPVYKNNLMSFKQCEEKPSLQLFFAGFWVWNVSIKFLGLNWLLVLGWSPVSRSLIITVLKPLPSHSTYCWKKKTLKF